MLLIAVAAVQGTTVQAIARQGSTGEQVRLIQNRLIAQGYLSGPADGIFGAQTADAVRRFQQARGITVDGIAGVVTMTALGILFRQGSRGEDVTSIQQKLKTLGYHTSATDG